MTGSKADIIAQLQKDILLMQGFKPASAGDSSVHGLNFMKEAFPNGHFPTGAIHEFFCNNTEEAAATAGFMGGLISSINKKNGATIWISATQTIFPPALKSFGIDPQNMIFIHLKKEKDQVWAMEEALKCAGVACVVGAINEISFTDTRRMQLAVEQTKVTGFLLRQQPKNMATACVTRWKIHSIPCDDTLDLPGLTFPRWHVSLLKVRNGKPGNWQLEWKEGNFYAVAKESLVAETSVRKIS